MHGIKLTIVILSHFRHKLDRGTMVCPEKEYACYRESRQEDGVKPHVRDDFL